MGNWIGCGNAEKECGIRNVAKLFSRERVWFLRGKFVRSRVAGDAVVDLNKMFFSGNGLEPLLIQTVVHLRSAAS
jgi:hypothetical protein